MNQKKAARPWFIYLIKTVQDTLYCGVTTCIERRLKEHRNQSIKTAKALRGKAPLTLVYAASIDNKSDALKTEIWVKKQKRTQKLSLIRGDILLPIAHCRIEANVFNPPD
ncbi:GIY-YIG nuclease family protein [Agaribacter marinus]|uniref:GIY-YIG nuclease family protein n=1 Tax=Agaribacter marinus TaxID=1431249 RepID=UPI0024E0EB41|nr:GIY-YIG nuclease family protein [Agaribacter marinus]